MKLDLRQLRHVLALDLYRSFGRAAAAIGLTQPALSRSVQALEQELGARLFDRDRSRVVPTAVGQRLVELGRALVTQADLAERELQQMIGLADGLLRIGAGPYAAEISVGTAVGRLARQHPGILVDVAVGDWPDLYRRLVADEVDLVVAETSLAEGDDRVVVEPLPRHQAVFYCRAGHPLATGVAPGLEDVVRFPFAMTIVPNRLLESLGKVGLKVRPDLPQLASTTEFRVETPYLARKIVLESDVIGIALPRQLEHELRLGHLVALPIDVPWLATNYGILRLAGRTPSPASEAFLRILRAVEDEVAAASNGSARLPGPSA